MGLRLRLGRVPAGKEIQQFEHNRNKDGSPCCPEEIFEEPKRDVAPEKVGGGACALDLLSIYRPALTLLVLIRPLGSTR